MVKLRYVNSLIYTIIRKDIVTSNNDNAQEYLQIQKTLSRFVRSTDIIVSTHVHSLDMRISHANVELLFDKVIRKKIVKLQQQQKLTQQFHSILQNVLKD